MIHLFKTCMITAFILGLTWSAPLRAQDQRYISIRNTDTIWLPGNICAYQFRLDNGGNGEGFGPLTITLQLKDKYGQTLVTRKMETEAFGDSNATRTTDAFMETECVENVATTNGTYVLSRLSGAAMLTVTMVRKADYSGYRLFITPEMEGYPTDENQAAAYMNKIIEKEIMRAPEQYLWIHRRFKTRPVGESSLYI